MSTCIRLQTLAFNINLSGHNLTGLLDYNFSNCPNFLNSLSIFVYFYQNLDCPKLFYFKYTQYSISVFSFITPVKVYGYNFWVSNSNVRICFPSQEGLL